MITKLLEFVFRLFIALGCLLCVAFASALMVGIAAVVVILPVYAVWKWELTPWIGYPLAVLNCFFIRAYVGRNGRRNEMSEKEMIKTQQIEFGVQARPYADHVYRWKVTADESKEIPEIKPVSEETAKALSEQMERLRTMTSEPKANDRPDPFVEICKEIMDLHEKKNHDYGGSFDKTMNRFGPVALTIRLSDKLNRFESLVMTEAKVKEESIIDTLKDLASYAIMSVAWYEEQNGNL